MNLRRMDLDFDKYQILFFYGVLCLGHLLELTQNLWLNFIVNAKVRWERAVVVGVERGGGKYFLT